MIYRDLSQYSKNILKLFSGTAIAQAIPILSAPLMTRIYSPGEFGIYATFLAISALITIILTMRLEIAILLPESDDEASSITSIALFAASIATLLIAFVIYIGYMLFGISSNIGSIVLLVPISCFAHAVYSILYYQCLRFKKYTILARSRVLLALVIFLFSVIYPLFDLDNGLILAVITSYIVSILYIITYEEIKYNNIDSNVIKHVFTKYKNYPLIDMPTALIIQLSSRLPVLIYSNYFPPTLIGYYTLSQRMIDLPTSVITSAISDGFKQKAAKDYNETGSFYDVYKETRKMLILIAIIPYLLVQFYAPQIFLYTFGSDWLVAGFYAQILAPLFLLRFIVSPLTYSLYIRNELGRNFVGQFIKLVLSIFALMIGVLYTDIDLGLTIFVIANSIVYIYYYFISLKCAKKGKIGVQ